MVSRNFKGQFQKYFSGCSLCEAGIPHGWIDYWGGHAGHYGISLHNYAPSNSIIGCVTCAYDQDMVLHLNAKGPKILGGFGRG